MATIAVVHAGLSVPSSTRLLADRLRAATLDDLRRRGIEATATTIDLRTHARDLADHLVTGFPNEALREALDRATRADGLIAVTPVFSASYSGLFKMFFDVLDKDALAGMPVLMGATAGTARHSLVLDHALRPLFAYLRAVPVPTGVFAATEDWAGAEGSTPALADRIDRAAGEFGASIAGGFRPSKAAPEVDGPFGGTPSFETLLRGGRP